MGRLLRYIYEGMAQSITIGTPDFSQNNQYTDMLHIGDDMRYAIGRTVTNVKENGTEKSHKRQNGRKHR